MPSVPITPGNSTGSPIPSYGLDKGKRLAAQAAAASQTAATAAILEPAFFDWPTQPFDPSFFGIPANPSPMARQP